MEVTLAPSDVTVGIPSGGRRCTAEREKYLTKMPVSNDPCGELRYATPNETNSYQILGRVDWRRNSQDSVFVRYYISDANLKSYLDPTNVLNHRIGLPDRAQSVIVGDTYVLNPTTVSTFRINFSRSAVQRLPPDGIPTVTSLGA